MSSDTLEPVIVVTRDPDYEDQISLYGLPERTLVIYLDLGSNFDIGRPGTGDEQDIQVWLEAKFLQLDGLPPGHPAGDEVSDVVDRVCRRFGIQDPRIGPHTVASVATRKHVTNDDRASWAEEALRAFAVRTGLVFPEDSYEAACDLIADLHHWWDRHGVEGAAWDDVVASASRHYGFETDPDNEPDDPD